MTDRSVALSFNIGSDGMVRAKMYNIYRTDEGECVTFNGEYACREYERRWLDLRERNPDISDEDITRYTLEQWFAQIKA